MKREHKIEQAIWGVVSRWRDSRLSFCLVVHFNQRLGVKCLSVYQASAQCVGFLLEQIFPDHKHVAELETNISEMSK